MYAHLKQPRPVHPAPSLQRGERESQLASGGAPGGAARAQGEAALEPHAASPPAFASGSLAHVAPLAPAGPAPASGGSSPGLLPPLPARPPPRASAGVERLEKEAWASASTATRASSPEPLSPLSPLSRPAQAASPGERTLFDSIASDAAAPLDAALRQPLEDRFGTSLAMVRVHTGERARAVARSLDARAWTFGHHIGFAHGAFAPESEAGRSLIRHEAVHVLQQAGGPPALLLDEEPRGVEFFFSVHVDRELDSDELLLAFVQQYAGLPTREQAAAARDARNWRWTGTPQIADADAVRRGYVLIRVRDRSLSPASAEERAGVRATVAGMDEGERAELNAEVDRRFWQSTRYREGEPLGTGADDRRMAQYWLQVRDNLVRTRQSILALPQHVRDILFDPDAARRLTPADYETALRVGEKLAAMSAAELADWRSRTTSVTDDLATFEASLDAYLAEEAQRRTEQLELGRSAARLHSMEELYSLRANVRATERLASLPASDEFGVSDPTVVDARSELPGLREQLQAALAESGFANMAEFEAAIAVWRANFERETVRIADVMLDRVDHILFEAERGYAQSAQPLAAAVAGSGAPGHYSRSDEQARLSISLSAPISAMNDRMIDEAGALDAAMASAEASRAGEAAIAALSPTHPILSFPDFPRGRLGRAAPEDVQALVLDYIAEHRASVRSTRDELHSDRDFIYELDQLLAASKQAQGITPGSIYDRIIQDHISERGLTALLEGIAVGIIAIALTVASLGTGALAVAAGAAAFGLSAWQALEAFESYVQRSDAADAQLLSDDPSIAWLVIAVVGAAADLGAAVAAVRALRPAALAFNEAGDVAALREAIEALPALDARISNAVLRQADTQVAIQAQWRALIGIGTRPNDVLVAVAEGYYRFMLLAWHFARRGFYRFDQYLAELQRANVIADAAALTPAEVTALRAPFDDGLRRAAEGFVDPTAISAELRGALSRAEMDDAAAYGRSLGLDDAEVIDVLELQVRVAREADASALSPRALQSAMRDKAGPVDELVADVRGLPESGTQVVGAVEQSYHIGVTEGRRFLEGRGLRQWEGWINPFDFNGRYGQGLDDVFVDEAGHLWVVEYKGGSATLSPGQMDPDWVQRNIVRLRTAGYGNVAADLQAALDAGTLRGIAVSTPHGEPTHVIREYTY